LRNASSSTSSSSSPGAGTTACAASAPGVPCAEQHTLTHEPSFARRRRESAGAPGRRARRAQGAWCRWARARTGLEGAGVDGARDGRGAERAAVGAEEPNKGLASVPRLDALRSEERRVHGLLSQKEERALTGVVRRMQSGRGGAGRGGTCPCRLCLSNSPAGGPASQPRRARGARARRHGSSAVAARTFVARAFEVAPNAVVAHRHPVSERPVPLLAKRRANHLPGGRAALSGASSRQGAGEKGGGMPRRRSAAPRRRNLCAPSRCGARAQRGSALGGAWGRVLTGVGVPRMLTPALPERNAGRCTYQDAGARAVRGRCCPPGTGALSPGRARR